MLTFIEPKVEIPKVELKELPPHLEYAFLEENNKLPVIISKDLSQDEKTSLINVLKNRKQAIAWKLSDIRGIDPEFCSHKILLEDDYEPSVQHQRRVNPKIHDVIKKEVEKLLDAGLIYPISDSPWVSPVHCVPKKGDKMLKRCEDTKLALNWEKSHFMVKEGIVLGHKISRKGIEVDKAKVDVISKLPHPTTVKGIRSFLGHAGFYRRFIKDFSKISRPMTHLLEKNTPFIFSEDCILAFQTLKKKLTEAPILIAPNWDQPFEIMCDVSDYAIGAVLGQRIGMKHCRDLCISQTAGDHRKLQLNELSELRDQAYENSLIYKEKTKKLHDSKIKNRIFNVGDQVLLFNSRLKIFSGKLKSRWSGPFTITEVYPYGTAKLSHTDGSNFKVNCHRLKHYYGGDTPPLVIPDLQTFPKDN
ncbi:reverse transcriptase domain-containing protein [Tanacetum coccineum]|uniref:Reverse transcriptase domain-containing protein n=1 Tax=Tanacetum coccineum TaxID=301880 RepID=A0ABQ4YGW4_9ASTR